MQQMLERLHGCIQHILSKVPSAINQLQTELRQDFPHPSDTFANHMDYVDNVLRVMSYAPYIKTDLITMIFDKVTVLDSLMQRKVEYLEEELEDFNGKNLAHEVSLIFSKRTVEEDDEPDMDDDASDSDEESVVDEFEDPNEKRLDEETQQVAKLDALMMVLFDYFQPHFEFSKANMNQQFASFDQLFNMFSRVVLKTDRTSHIQALIFHYAQTSEELSERFVQSLVSIITDFNADKLVRRSAASYLASFITRGARVSRHLSQHTFHILSTEIERLRVLHEKNDMVLPDLNRFGSFYSIFQSLMYIFCFKWRELLTEELDDETNFDVRELTWPQDIVDTFRRSISSRMNPLKVCSDTIVDAFAKAVRQLQFLFIDGFIEQNTRIPLARSMAMANGGFSIVAESHNLSNNTNHREVDLQLPSYFPFEPYQLPLSKSRVAGEYSEFRDVFVGSDEACEYSDSDDTGQEMEVTEGVFDARTETESVGSRRSVARLAA
jgi:RNA polymerase I-specific transcription initiation factor RRN3